MNNLNDSSDITIQGELLKFGNSNTSVFSFERKIPITEKDTVHYLSLIHI